MGYDTRYTITKIDGDAAAFRRAFDKHPIAIEGHYKWFGVADASDSWKWYEHEQHIVDAMLDSKLAGLTLHGEGDDQGDVWDKEFVLIPEHRPTGEREMIAPRVKVILFKYELVKKPGAAKEMTRSQEERL